MVLKMWEKPAPGANRGPVAPTASIGNGGMTLNRSAMDLIGKKAQVVLFWDGDNATVGLWFWKDEVKNGKARPNAYKITKARSGTGRINSKVFVKQNGLVKKVKDIGIKRFLLKLDKSMETRQDFYTFEVVAPKWKDDESETK